MPLVVLLLWLSYMLHNCEDTVRNDHTTMTEKIQEVYRQLPRIDNDLRDWALIITKG
jgi:hypothetical protein